MSSIFVDGLGQVDIKGTTPTEEENKAIIEALQLDNKSINEELAPQPVGLEKIGGRPVFEAAGSFAGAVPGLVGGLPGAVATGVGGAMAGGQVYDIFGFRANAIVAANVTWTLPVSDGSSNQFLKTDGTGTLSWGTAATASPILESYQTISSNYTITSGSNGFSVGPVTIATGVVVTVGTGQVWLIAA